MWTQSCGPHSDDSFPGLAAGMRTELLETKQKHGEKKQFDLSGCVENKSVLIRSANKPSYCCSEENKALKAQ